MEQQYIDRFLTARRELIRREFSGLNRQQQEAVLTTEGPLLLLAGAGSGKTTALISRIANLMRFGSASDSPELPAYITEQNVEELERALRENLPMDERLEALCAFDPVAPWSIIAITFTNKAANELKGRLESMLGAGALDVWAMTFHSACCRILRRDIERLGYKRNFTIYDTTDSERVMKDVISDLQLDERQFPARMVLRLISRAKDQLLQPEDYAQQAKTNGDYRLQLAARCYAEYQRRLLEANALDFDDIILQTVLLLRQFEDVRSYYQRKFRYVLVDEYQDTNNMQYLLTSLLAGGYENICVVGDDDQSIYRFRGATIENILSFERQYKGAKLIRLEQNYRSTKSILEAANAVIAHNRGRKGKHLWTRNETGDKLTFYTAADESDEANYVSGRIFALRIPFKDAAILYRTNAQSNALERSFKANGIPYRIIGGTRFFDRAEVKDMLAYLQLINNRADDLRLRRIINNPPRGIGGKTLETVSRLADSAGLPLYAILTEPENYPALERAADRLTKFAALIEDCASCLDTLPLPEFYDVLLEKTGYAAVLEEKNDPESRGRLENVRELRSSLVGYVENHPEDASLNGFLEEIALYTDIEQYDANADAVVMMTMHAAKGLEFPHVFLVGMEEGLFPGSRAIEAESGMELEEERRLCYVAMTRAKKSLTICCAAQRMLYGHTTSCRVSRFVKEIPQELLQGKIAQPRPAYTVSTGFAPSRPGFAPSRPGYAARQSAPSRSQPVKAAQPSAPVPDFRPGERVRHSSFGEGMVISALKTGNDALLEIAFDEIGTKRLMARAAAAYLKRI